MASFIIILAVSYLLGSVPNGFLAGVITGVDVRTRGSGNIGATNVLRVLGKPWGFTVFFLDAAKGLVAVRIAVWIANHSAILTNHIELVCISAATACVIGHSFPVWLKFKGGKGVATSAGALLGVTPVAAVTIFLVWLCVFIVSKYVSLASIAAALALPVTMWILMKTGVTKSAVLFWFSTAMTALVVWRHRSNISRLLNGTEPRFSRR